MSKKIIVGIVILILVLGGGMWWWMSAGSGGETQEDTTAKEIFATSAPEPTVEEPKFEKGDFSIKILNGSGVAGLAGVLEKDLQEAGFKVDSTDNADNYDYKNTIIQAKEKIPEAFLELLKGELTAEYGRVETETLEQTDDVDIVIIIGGKQEAEEETDVEATTPSPKVTGVDTDSNPESTKEAEL